MEMKDVKDHLLYIMIDKSAAEVEATNAGLDSNLSRTSKKQIASVIILRITVEGKPIGIVSLLLNTTNVQLINTMSRLSESSLQLTWKLRTIRTKKALLRLVILQLMHPPLLTKSKRQLEKPKRDEAARGEEMDRQVTVLHLITVQFIDTDSRLKTTKNVTNILNIPIPKQLWQTFSYKIFI